ncbi:hypothetical protein [Amycolatopsis sp. NPDC052450]|uniref:hypothetical protein n=1 Tax=Amycolatopsis sp. NPDC052450 TaxID=3363937 RepID=UPI0037C86C8B
MNTLHNSLVPDVADVDDEGFYPDGLTESAIDALLEQVDRELAADEHAASAAFLYDFTDQRRASRTRRRAGREALRSLPTRLPITRQAGTEAA